MKLKLIAKSYYGSPHYYPDCPMSIALQKLTRGKKAFTLNHLKILRQAGFEFEINAEIPPEILEELK